MKKTNEYLMTEDGQRFAKQFIQASKSNGLIASVYSVSSSGMTRKADFRLVCKSGKNFSILYLNYAICQLCGYKMDKDGHIILHGCGMDMLFDTFYNVARELQYNGYKIETNIHYNQL